MRAEAYALAEGGDMTSGGGDLYAREAIRTLLTEVENNRTNLMVVLAGYKDKARLVLCCVRGLSARASRADASFLPDGPGPRSAFPFDRMARVAQLHAG